LRVKLGSASIAEAGLLNKNAAVRERLLLHNLLSSNGQESVSKGPIALSALGPTSRTGH